MGRSSCVCPPSAHKQPNTYEAPRLSSTQDSTSRRVGTARSSKIVAESRGPVLGFGRCRRNRLHQTPIRAQADAMATCGSCLENVYSYLAKLRLKPTRRLGRPRPRESQVPRPRPATEPGLTRTASPDRWIHRTPPASPRSPSHPTGGKGTPPPALVARSKTRLVRHEVGLIRRLDAEYKVADCRFHQPKP